MLEINCSICGKRLQADDTFAGKHVLCPDCQNSVAVPARREPSPAQAIATTEHAPHARIASPGSGDDGAFRDGPPPLRHDGPEPSIRKDLPSIFRRLIPVGVVAVILMALVGLLVPAVQKVRQAAARTQSVDNVKQVALSFHGFHDANKRLPFPGGLVASTNPVDKTFGDPRTGSWAYQILPYIDQMPLFNAPPTGLTPNPANQTSLIPAYLCPGRGRNSFGQTGNAACPDAAWTDYMINGLINDPITTDTLTSGIVTIPAATLDNPSPNGDNKRTLVGITDGTSHTIFVGHGMIQQDDWSNPAGASARGGAAQCSDIYLLAAPVTRGKRMNVNGNRLARGQNIDAPTLIMDSWRSDPDVTKWGSPFPQGALMGMGDATVRLFPYSMNNGADFPISPAGVGTPNSFGAFLTPNGGEAPLLPDA